MNREELEDLISDAISDSLEMDWNSRDGAKAVISMLEREGLRVIGADSDLAIAIGEHAFRAGFHEAVDMGAKPDDEAEAVENAWCCYTPPEDLCGKAF